MVAPTRPDAAPGPPPSSDERVGAAAPPSGRPALARSNDRWVAGVAGGIADHLGIDPVIVRVAVVVLAVSTGIGVLVYVAAWWLLPESRVGRIDHLAVRRLDLVKRARQRPGLLLLLSVFFLVSAAFSAFEATFALFTASRFAFSAANIGYVFAFIGVILAVVNGLLVGRMVVIVGEQRLIPSAIACIAAGLLLVSGSQTLAALLLGCAVLAVGMGFNNPTLTSAVSRLSHSDEQGGMLGLAQSLAALGRIIGPAAGGYLYERFGPTVPHYAAATIMFAGVLIAFAGVRRSRLHVRPGVPEQ